MQKKLIAAFMAIAVFAAFAVAASSASAVSLQAPTGTALANGTAIKGVNVGETIMTNLNKETLIKCSNVVQEGSIVSNGPSVITGEITSAVFKGTGTEERCTTSVPGVYARVTTAITGGLPYCLKTLEGTDTFEVRGGKCAETSRSIKYTIDFSDGGKCGYEKANLTGTFTTDTSTVTPQDAALTTDEQGIFKRYEAEGSFSSFLCPTEARLDMTFTLETTGGAPIFVR